MGVGKLSAAMCHKPGETEPRVGVQEYACKGTLTRVRLQGYRWKGGATRVGLEPVLLSCLVAWRCWAGSASIKLVLYPMNAWLKEYGLKGFPSHGSV